MSIDNLADAFCEELRDILSAEKQLLKALPKMVKQASSPDLRTVLESHLAETEKHVERVEKAFEETGKSARAKTCEAMQGLIKEAAELIQENGDPAIRDAMMIAVAQKIEHYEIASYGTLCTWAKTLAYPNALNLLKQNINEEERADRNLSTLSKPVNMKAMAV